MCLLFFFCAFHFTVDFICNFILSVNWPTVFFFVCVCIAWGRTMGDNSLWKRGDLIKMLWWASAIILWLTFSCHVHDFIKTISPCINIPFLARFTWTENRIPGTAGLCLHWGIVKLSSPRNEVKAVYKSMVYPRTMVYVLVFNLMVI